MIGVFDRLFVDRHVYERRPSGGHVVTFTRRAQLGLVVCLVMLLALCLGLGASAAYLWLATQPSAGQAARPMPGPSTTADASGRVADLTRQVSALSSRNEDLARRLQAASGSAKAADGADKMTAEIATLKSELATVTAARVKLADALQAVQARTPTESPPAAGLPLASDRADRDASPDSSSPVELAVVLRERNAARQQLDSLMASTSKLKAELDRLKAKAAAVPTEPAAPPPPADAQHVAHLQHDVDDMETAVNALTKQLLDGKREAAARESELQAKLGQARFDQQAASAEADRLRQRVAELEAGGGPGASHPADAPPDAMVPPPADAALRSQLQAALARLRTLDPAFAQMLEQGQPPPPPGPAAGAPAPPLQ